MSCQHCKKVQQLTGNKFARCRPHHKERVRKVLKRVERNAEKAAREKKGAP